MRLKPRTRYQRSNHVHPKKRSQCQHILLPCSNSAHKSPAQPSASHTPAPRSHAPSTARPPLPPLPLQSPNTYHPGVPQSSDIPHHSSHPAPHHHHSQTTPSWRRKTKLPTPKAQTASSSWQPPYPPFSQPRSAVAPCSPRHRRRHHTSSVHPSHATRRSGCQARIRKRCRRHREMCTFACRHRSLCARSLMGGVLHPMMGAWVKGAEDWRERVACVRCPCLSSEPW